MIYNTRIAPSPTGDMHIGTARTAYFNWLAARATGGKFLLRIDDTDQKRSDPKFTQVILETLKWLGLEPDEIIYQSQRFDFYRGYARYLMAGTPGGSFAKEVDGAVVLDLRGGPYDHYTKQIGCWHDELAGDIPITEDDMNNIDGMVLIKSDGSPTYNFCSILDDMEFGINYVIRGVDHITNTAKQRVLYYVLHPDTGTEMDPEWPKFAHLGLICVGGKPMSKRDGASSMLHYMNAGYDPDAMLNFLARMGWGPTVDDKTTKLLPREKMLEMFLTGGKMKSQAAGFDKDKLESFDRKYKASKGVWRNKEKLS